MGELGWRRLPFRYDDRDDFRRKLMDWLGDVFYEVLPSKGFEVREEQVYTAFRMADALCAGSTLFAEAGFGTGKTFAYVLPGLCYARMTGSPMILTSASPALQDQLVGEDGDISDLSRLLNLDIDARLAKDPSNYVCELKAERLDPSKGRDVRAAELLDWYYETARGDRAEVPWAPDDLWARVAWDEKMNCDVCTRRGYCRMTEAKRYLYEAQDFVVCSHEVFFRDLWTRRELMLDHRLPLLPRYSGVVFDEGHRIELPAAKSLGRPLSRPGLQLILTELVEQPDLRRRMVDAVKEVTTRAKGFFAAAESAAIKDLDTDRWHLKDRSRLREECRRLMRSILDLEDELVTEQEMHRETDYEIEVIAYQDRVERFREGLLLLQKADDEIVVWWEPKEKALWVIPRGFSTQMATELFDGRKPVIFTSGSLSVNGSFSHIAEVTGAAESDYATSIVGTPFDLANQITIYLPGDLPPSGSVSWEVVSIEAAADLVEAMGGRSLVLTPFSHRVDQLRSVFTRRAPGFNILYEGDGDRGGLIERFRDDVSSVLVGTSFWEGVDVPGESLSAVVVVDLPFPSRDPLVEARRADVQRSGRDPFVEIDVPEMVTRLRQGFGRLIRGSEDRGVIALIDWRPRTDLETVVMSALPEGAQRIARLEDLRGWVLTHLQSGDRVKSKIVD